MLKECQRRQRRGEAFELPVLQTRDGNLTALAARLLCETMLFQTVRGSTGSPTWKIKRSRSALLFCLMTLFTVPDAVGEFAFWLYSELTQRESMSRSASLASLSVSIADCITDPLPASVLYQLGRLQGLIARRKHDGGFFSTRHLSTLE